MTGLRLVLYRHFLANIYIYITPVLIRDGVTGLRLVLYRHRIKCALKQHAALAAAAERLAGHQGDSGPTGAGGGAGPDLDLRPVSHTLT